MYDVYDVYVKTNMLCVESLRFNEVVTRSLTIGKKHNEVIVGL